MGVEFKITALAFLATLTACSADRGENSAFCGLTHMASATKVLEQASTPVRTLNEWPAGVEGEVPVRVVGYGTGSGLVGTTDDGVMIGFEGNGFPQLPGFGIAMVDDSSEVFRGILIWDKEPPLAFPQVGAVAGTSLVIPLYALRINWSAVNDPRCPLFSAPDSTGAE